MWSFQPLPQRQGRQRFPLGLALIAIAVAAVCLEAQTQFVFASQLHPVGVDVRMLLDGAQKPLLSTARLSSGASVQCPPTSSWSFRPGCMLLLCVATAGIALTRKQRCTWRGAKAHRAIVRCNVTGFDTGPLLGSQPLRVCCTQGSVPAAAPTIHRPSTPATATSTFMVDTSKPALPNSGLILASESPATESKDLVQSGLCSASPAFRVSTARRACRHFGIGRGAAGRTRSARRAVGAWLQASHQTPIAPQKAWDPSRLRMQLQVGLQVLAQRNKSGQPRGFKQLSTKCISLVDHSRGIPVSNMNKS